MGRGTGATKGRGPGTAPTFRRALRTGGPPRQEAVCQQRLLDVLVLRPQRQGAEQLRVVGRAAVVEHVRQFQRLHAAPLPEHLRVGQQHLGDPEEQGPICTPHVGTALPGCPGCPQPSLVQVPRTEAWRFVFLTCELSAPVTPRLRMIFCSRCAGLHV